MTSKRQLAAIMFTDISGFSAMMQKNEGLAKKVLERQRSVLSTCHEQFSGKILQYIGDGTLSIFNSAAAAVECAVAMQVEYRKEPYVPLRIGIHSGDITYDENGAFGDGVNVTSRIERKCIPGAIYVSDKIYDDIKNHPWLEAVNLGPFNLRNISSAIDLYAITSKGMVVPSLDSRSLHTENAPDEQKAETTGGRKKLVAAFLALFFGMFGMHRFYLGQRGKGIAYLVAFGITLMLAVEGDLPLVALVAIVAFIDAILLFAMPRQEFDGKYNQKVVQTKVTRREVSAKRSPERPAFSETVSPITKLMTLARNSVAKGKYQEAVRIFDKVLDIDETYPDAHYGLAACFSMLKDEDMAFFHLSEAVANGFHDFNKLKGDIYLHYLRSQPLYDSFVANGYKVVGGLPEPKPNMLDDNEFDPLILEKIELLGNQLENGELSAQEFEIQKRKILGKD